MDKDTGSIGGLEYPPPVTRKLYYASIVCDTLGLLLCSLSGWRNALVLAGYVAFSKCYSWRGIRLKKYPYLGWLMVMFFQGGYTFMLANMATGDQVSLQWFSNKNLWCMLIASLLIGGHYPLTQIYQHIEDATRGDYTISYKLGIRGTFCFSALLFLAGFTAAFFYFHMYYEPDHFFVFLGCNIPAIAYFLYWAFKASGDPSFANYSHAMRMTRISSVCMVVCFSVLMAWNG
jgi:1,4-dihydroxy-2-naphthoate octaprenyltransferase